MLEVDRDDVFDLSEALDVLDGAIDAQSQIELGTDGLAGLTDLDAAWGQTMVDDFFPAGRDLAAQSLGQPFQLVEMPDHATTAGDQHVHFPDVIRLFFGLRSQAANPPSRTLSGDGFHLRVFPCLTIPVKKPWTDAHHDRTCTGERDGGHDSPTVGRTDGQELSPFMADGRDIGHEASVQAHGQAGGQHAAKGSGRDQDGVKVTLLLQLDQDIANCQRILLLELGETDLDHRVKGTGCHSGFWSDAHTGRFIRAVRIDLPGGLKEINRIRGACSSR